MSLPKDRSARNALPIWDGFIEYFPDVFAEVAKVSVVGNKQHNLGAKLHWDTTVSTDHKNKAFRHMLDDSNGEVMDDDDTFHLAKAVWRLSAALQIRIWQRDGKDEHGQPIQNDNPAIGIRDTQPIPEITFFTTQPCACGARVFTFKRGKLPPSVYSGSVLHTVKECGKYNLVWSQPL